MRIKTIFSSHLIMIFFFLSTFIYFFIERGVLYVGANDKNFSSGMIVNEMGDIEWYSHSLLASTYTRWRVKGYHILLEKTSPYGYPFGLKNDVERPNIRINFKAGDVEIKNVDPNAGAGERVYVRYRIPWQTLKTKIEENSSFYDLLKEKLMDDGQVYVYINGIFEVLTLDSSVRKSDLILFEDGYYRSNKGEKGRYDIIGENVYRLYPKEYINCEEITNAAQWKDKGEWKNKDNHHYNNPVKIKVDSNLVIKLVDTMGKLIGKDIKNKSEMDSYNKFLSNNPSFLETHENKELLKKGVLRKWKISSGKKDKKTYYNPSIAFKVSGYAKFTFDKHKRKGKKAIIRMPEKIESGTKGKKFIFTSCYTKDGKGRKYYKNIDTEAEKEKGFLSFSHESELGIPTIYGEYTELDDELIIPNEDEMEGETETETFGEIGAGTLEKSDFDIEEGIPVTEAYYKRFVTSNYILNYRFIKKTGKRHYYVKSKVTWELSKDKKELKNEKKVDKVVKNYETVIERVFSYWVIDRLEYYTIKGGRMNNPALEDSDELFLPSSYQPPELFFVHNEEEDFHVKEPEGLKEIINLGTKKAYGDSIPYFNPDVLINSKIGKIRVKNDSLSFGKKVYMDDTEKMENTEKPIELPEPELISDKQLYEEGKKIARTIRNGVYKTEGVVEYELKQELKSSNPPIINIHAEVNSIKVHTPVVCSYSIRDAKEWCQLVEPRLENHQLVLTKDFSVKIFSEGSHKPIKGYGTRNYEKYTDRKEAIFPFDVFSGTQFYKAYSPIPMEGTKTFTLPSYVKEGVYTINLYSYALNSLRREENSQIYANTELRNHIAANYLQVEVSGRLMDFSLTGIKNSSLWDEVFQRKEINRGFSLDTLPLIKGDHPIYNNLGDFKKGYSLLFGVTTIGSYLSEPYGVEMNLSFFVYDKDYRSRREVDVYYEAISKEDGKKLGLVKVGSSVDKRNIHFFKEEGKKVPMFTYARVLMPREGLSPWSKEDIQRWRAEYSLPARLYVTEKGFDLKLEAKRRTAFFLDEDCFIKSGKLVVKAELFSLKKGKKILDYINTKNTRYGHLNNWKYESRERVKKVFGREVSFQDGEVFVFDIGKSIRLERMTELRKGW